MGKKIFLRRFVAEPVYTGGLPAGDVPAWQANIYAEGFEFSGCWKTMG